LDAILVKKVDFEDLQKVLESKIDVASFQNLARNVEFKADRHELQALNSEGKTSNEDLDKLVSMIRSQTSDLESQLS
jgi:phage tail tape-measure protein